MKITILNPDYKRYWSNYDAYAPIGMHIGMKRMSPRKYIEIDLKTFIQMLLRRSK